MGTFVDFRNKLLALNTEKIASDSMIQTRDDLEDWQREQLFSGKNSKNNFIKPKYKLSTRVIKRKKGQPTDRVTLKDNGDFYDGIVADIGTSVYNITSTDSKTFDLERKYSEAIFGLNKISRAGYASDLDPIYQRNIKKALGL